MKKVGHAAFGMPPAPSDGRTTRGFGRTTASISWLPRRVRTTATSPSTSKTAGT